MIKSEPEQQKANLAACKNRYAGKRLYLEAPSAQGFIFYTTKYRNLPFKVVGVGKDRMTVEALYDNYDISQIRSANIPCNATKV